MIENRFRMSLTASFIFLATVSVSRAQYSGGSGTADDPYQIATAEDLIALGETPDDNDKQFILTADIDLDPNLPEGKVFDRAVIAPSYDTRFVGVFDGNGQTISHLTIEGESYIGLFGILGSGAGISNLGLEAADVNGTGSNVGGLVGSIGEWYAPDIIVANCYSTGSVRGASRVGGLVGINWTGASITSCYSTCSVTGEWAIGGLVGGNTGSIISCYSTGPVTGDGDVGGLTGNNGGSITTSFWNVETSGQSISAGGAGKSTATMQTASTFLTVGWDFVGEAENGGEDIWWILKGQDYPRLWWELTEDQEVDPAEN